MPTVQNELELDLVEALALLHAVAYQRVVMITRVNGDNVPHRYARAPALLRAVA